MAFAELFVTHKMIEKTSTNLIKEDAKDEEERRQIEDDGVSGNAVHSDEIKME